MTISIIRNTPWRMEQFGEKIIDFSKDRPFFGWEIDELEKCLAIALQEPIRIELATLIAEESRFFGEAHDRIEQRISRAGVAEIPWLRSLEARVATLWDGFEHSGTGTNVYFILLCESEIEQDKFVKRPEPWGLYVGMTSKRIARRFRIHLDPTDPHRSPVVTRRGWELLYSISSKVPQMKRADSLKFEKLVLDSLRGIALPGPIDGLPVNRVKGH
jgi:hypothetical protein